MKRIRLIRFLAIMLFLSPAACDSKPQTVLPTTTMQIGSGQFVLEKAISMHDQMVGLMHRESLAPDHGMIFINPREAPQTFWNHDTEINLDLIFLDSTSRVVDLKRLKAYDETNVSSSAPAQYIIELNAGAAASAHVKVGDHLALPPDVIRAAQQ